MSHATDTSAITSQVPVEDQSLLAANLEDMQEDIPSTQPRNEAYYMGTPPHEITQDNTRGQEITQDCNQPSMPFPMSAPPAIPTSQSMEIASKRRLHTSPTPAQLHTRSQATASQDVLSPTQPFVSNKISPEEKRLRQMDSISPEEVPNRPSSSASDRERLLEAQLQQAQRDNEMLRDRWSEDVGAAQEAYGKIKSTVKSRELQFQSAVAQARMQVADVIEAQNDAHQVQMAKMSIQHQQQEQSITAQARDAVMQSRLQVQRDTLSHEDKQSQLKMQAQEAVQSVEIKYQSQLQQLEQEAKQRILEKDLEMAELQKKYQDAQATSDRQQQSKEDRYNQLIEQSKEVLTSNNKEKMEMQMKIHQMEEERKRQEMVLKQHQESQAAQMNEMMQRQVETRQAEEAQRQEMIIEMERLRQEKEYLEIQTRERKEEPSIIQPPITEDKASQPKAADPWWTTSQEGYRQDPWGLSESTKGNKGKSWETGKGKQQKDTANTPLTQMIEEEMDNMNDLKTPPNEPESRRDYSKGSYPPGWNDPTKLGDWKFKRPPGSPGSTSSSDERFKRKPWDPPESDKPPGQQLPPIPETTTSEESNSYRIPQRPSSEKDPNLGREATPEERRQGLKDEFERKRQMLHYTRYNNLVNKMNSLSQKEREDPTKMTNEYWQPRFNPIPQSRDLEQWLHSMTMELGKATKDPDIGQLMMKIAAVTPTWQEMDSNIWPWNHPAFKQMVYKSTIAQQSLCTR